MTDQEVDEVLSTDTEAPYGRKVDGSPKKTPGGRPPKFPNAPRGKTRATRASAGPKRSPVRAKSRGTDYTPALAALLSLPAIPLRFARYEGAKLDAIAIQMHAPAIAAGINATAQNHAATAALCDRLISVGPFADVIAPVLAFGAQLAVNHKAIPEETAALFGALPVDGLMQAAQQQVSEAEQAMAAAAGTP